MTREEKLALLEKARAARAYAYAPYSGFAVGAALLCADGRVFTGCNIESAAFAPTQCAERTALGKAVSEGARSFAAIAVVGAKQGCDGGPISPCGVCRQMLAEFSDGGLTVLMGDTRAGDGDFTERTLAQLLPMSFGAGDMR